MTVVLSEGLAPGSVIPDVSPAAPRLRSPVGPPAGPMDWPQGMQGFQSSGPRTPFSCPSSLFAN